MTTIIIHPSSSQLIWAYAMRAANRAKTASAVGRMKPISMEYIIGDRLRIGAPHATVVMFVAISTSFMVQDVMMQCRISIVKLVS